MKVLIVVMALAALVGCGSEAGTSGSITDQSGWLDGIPPDADGYDLGFIVELKEDKVPEDVPLPWEIAEEPEVVVPKPGAPCVTKDDCDDAPCVPTPDGWQCSMRCEDECNADGWTCYPLVTGWPPGLCLKTDYMLCRACLSTPDCLEDWSGTTLTCADYPGGSSFCSKKCESGSDCPEDFECVEAKLKDVPLPGNVCIRKDGICECNEFHVNAKTSCLSSNAYGQCSGFQVCTEEGFVCDAPEALEETCNGKDDDCDKKVDEELGNQSCGKGICFHEVEACKNGKPVFCNPMQGMASETCNGLDDNCNGEIDEIWAELTTPCDTPADPDMCKSGTWVCKEDGKDVECVGDQPSGPELCDGLDNDCNTMVDEGFGQTTCGLGICKHTVSNCEGGKDLVCDPFEGAAEDDSPDDGTVDENCDGIDGNVETAVFVDPAGGSDEGPGTIQSPVKTLDKATALAIAEGKLWVYMAKGDYPAPFSPASGLGYVGGYDPSMGWTRSLFNITRIKGASPALVCDSQSGLFLDTLTVETKDAANLSDSNYAAFLTFCTGVVVRNSTISAGDAGSGAPGAPGAFGFPGVKGEQGKPGCEYEGGVVCDACTAPAGGQGGSSPCFWGGNGGTPKGAWNDEGNPGWAGSGPAPGAGGAGGTSDNKKGGAGGLGSDGQGGNHGWAAAYDAVIDEAGFAGVTSPSGGDGTPGSGGGGGGCGGGESGAMTCNSYGGTGGGGGGGGCGGKGGKGGKGGGASFGIYLVSGELTLVKTKVYAGSGGKGGAGGAGGNGGTGGIGGDGGSGNGAGSGGKGGDGGGGGTGGSGAGGNGGPSFAVGCINNPLLAVEATTTLLPGAAGSGGASSFGGNKGYDGSAGPAFNCPGL